MNFAENLLTRHASGPAIISTDEDTLLSPVHYSWPELRELVRQYASALRGSGFRVGDIVAGKIFPLILHYSLLMPA